VVPPPRTPARHAPRTAAAGPYGRVRDALAPCSGGCHGRGATRPEHCGRPDAPCASRAAARRALCTAGGGTRQTRLSPGRPRWPSGCGGGTSPAGQRGGARVAKRRATLTQACRGAAAPLPPLREGPRGGRVYLAIPPRSAASPVASSSGSSSCGRGNRRQTRGGAPPRTHQPAGTTGRDDGGAGGNGSGGWRDADPPGRPPPGARTQAQGRHAAGIPRPAGARDRRRTVWRWRQRRWRRAGGHERRVGAPAPPPTGPNVGGGGVAR